MKSTYFIALYLAAIALLAFLFYLSIGTASAEEVEQPYGLRLGEYIISYWGIVIGVLCLVMGLFYIGVRKRFRKRFPKTRSGNKF